MDKIEVTQDQLKYYLEEHHFIRAALAKKMGVSESIVGDCFNHLLNRHGKPLSFTKKNVELLNQALQQISEELSRCKLKCSNEEEQASRRFINDDPAIIDGLRKISEYIKLRGLTAKVLGWNNRKCESNINLKESRLHVHIKREEIERINIEIMAIAGTLATWEVVADENAFDGNPAAAEDETEPAADVKPAHHNNKGTRTRRGNAFESGSQPWDNTSLPLPERGQLLRAQWPQGVLLYRVSDGYTAEGVDVKVLCRLSSSITPYTDNTTGVTTAYMSQDTMAEIQPRLVAEGRRVAFTNMYDE